MSGDRPSDVLLALAERCEREEPSRDLEISIFVASGLVNEAHCAAWCNQNGRTDLTRDRYVVAWAPNFCVSLDAAVSLVPEGWVIEHLGDNAMGPPGNLTAWGCRVELVNDAHEGPCTNEGDADTRPMAMCAAALKARAAILAVEGIAASPPSAKGASTTDSFKDPTP